LVLNFMISWVYKYFTINGVNRNKARSAQKKGTDGLNVSYSLVEHVHLLYYGSFFDQESLEIFG